MFTSTPTLLLAAAAGLVSGRDGLYRDSERYNKGAWGPYPSNHYHTTADYSPAIQVNNWTREAMSTSGSHIFIKHGIKHDPPSVSPTGLDASPLILSTDDLSAVYMNRSFPGVADVSVHTYRGKPILSFYGGPVEETVGFGNGFIFGYDQAYREIGLVAAEKLRVGADLHEFSMTSDKTALVTAYESKPWDLSALSSDPAAAHGRILDCVFQEVDLDTFEVLFQWRASDHIPMALSYQPVESGAYGWDFFHINSVQKSQGGDYLVSAGNMHSIYLIDGATGAPRWTLGGRANEFAELDYPPGENFTNPLLTMAWQNHAQFYPGSGETQLTVFDNHINDINGWGCSANCSRGLHLSLDAGRRQVRLLHEYLHPAGLWSQSQGSVQVLPGGNVFIGWGRNPALTEHLASGPCVFDVQFSPWRSPATGWRGLDSYRAFKADWDATPWWPPALAAETRGGRGGRGGRPGGVTAWMSWNGATGVRSWVLLGSAHSVDIDGGAKVLARAERDGFETVLWAEAPGVRYLRAVALDAEGRILRASDVFDLKTRTVSPAGYNVTDVRVKGQGTTTTGWGGGSHEADEEKGPEAGMPSVSYHDLLTYHWSWGGMLWGIMVVFVGVWAFSRFL